MKNDHGFSMVELIVTIAIMAILVGVLGIAVTNQMEKSRRTAALTDANAIYKMAQIALVESIVENSESFNYSVKFEETINGETVYLGRCTNQSVFKYLYGKYIEDHGAPPPGVSGSVQTGLSKDNDQYIASKLIQSIPGGASDITSGTLMDGPPLGVSSLTVANNPGTYGKVVFALAYDGNGNIIYFQCVYNGYFIQISGSESSAEKVSEDLKFNDWPRTRRTDVDTDGW